MVDEKEYTWTNAMFQQTVSHWRSRTEAAEAAAAKWRELHDDRVRDLDFEYARANAAEAEVERLREQVATLTTCDCGLPLSVGKCGICDNDE